MPFKLIQWKNDFRFVKASKIPTYIIFKLGIRECLMILERKEIDQGRKTHLLLNSGCAPRPVAIMVWGPGMSRQLNSV